MRGSFFHSGIMTVSRLMPGTLGEKVHFGKVSCPESLPILCAKHLTEMLVLVI